MQYEDITQIEKCKKDFVYVTWYRNGRYDTIRTFGHYDLCSDGDDMNTQPAVLVKLGYVVQKMAPLLKGAILNTVMLDAEAKDRLVQDYQKFADSFTELVERSGGKRRWTAGQEKEFEKFRPKP
jgi:hypothetical protein